jgi:hypothetical protein
MSFNTPVKNRVFWQFCTCHMHGMAFVHELSEPLVVQCW